MRNHFINYTTVGVFVAAMIVALLWALAQISGRTGPSDGYAIVMDAVTDIDYGTLVRYEGYKIGQVERIVPEWVNGKYQFRVFVSVEKDWKFPVEFDRAHFRIQLPRGQDGRGIQRQVDTAGRRQRRDSERPAGRRLLADGAGRGADRRSLRELAEAADQPCR